MRGKILMMVVAVAMLAATGAFAAGDPLPAGAVNPGTYVYVNNAWEPATFAMSWNSGPANSSGMSNAEVHSFQIVNHVSVAQWIEWGISGTRKDWRVLRPGIYGSNSVTATIRSNNDVIIEFYATDPIMQSEGGVTTEIPKWFSYSEGDSISGAEENGWVRGSEYTEEEPLLIRIADSAGLHAGWAYKLWERIEVVPSNTSAEYEGTGTVTLRLTNMKHWVDPDTGNFNNGNGGNGGV